MNGYNLTDRQKELLRKLVRYVREEGSEEPISGSYTLGQRCIRFFDGTTLEYQGDLVGDLDALCDAGLMSFRYSERGNKLYTIKQAGYDAIDNDFGAPLIQEWPVIVQPTKEQPDDLSLLEELRDELSVIRILHFHHPDFQSWHNTVKLSLRQFFGEGSYYVTEYDKIAWRTSDKSEDANEQHNLYLRSCATAEGLLKAAIRTFTVPPSEATATREGTQMPKSPPTVFISYAREDLEDARKLYNDLKQAGANPWLDKESLLPGQRWKVEIKRAIRESRYFLAVLSSNSVSRRGYVQKELAEALEILAEFPESEIFIIPARLDDCSPSHEKLRDLHWVDMFTEWEDGLEKILRAIQVPPEDKKEIRVVKPVSEPVRTTVSERRQPFEPEMILIPAGKFQIGTWAEDLHMLARKYGTKRKDIAREVPRHRVFVQKFEIGKYPVTNAQFKCFVDAGGYDEERYWTKAGWAWRQEEPEEHHWPRGWEDGQFPPERANHPVVNVTWYEAVAYTRWLAEVTSEPYRLPKETEWEKGARWTDGREFPWGDGWDESRCNTAEGGHGTTTPVGVFPDGASPYGVLDMAGNVWEWCDDWLQAYRGNPFPDEDYGETHKVLRGSSWKTYGLAHCAFRYARRPGNPSDDIGFRCAKDSP